MNTTDKYIPEGVGELRVMMSEVKELRKEVVEAYRSSNLQPDKKRLLLPGWLIIRGDGKSTREVQA